MVKVPPIHNDTSISSIINNIPNSIIKYKLDPTIISIIVIININFLKPNLSMKMPQINLENPFTILNKNPVI